MFWHQRRQIRMIVCTAMITSARDRLAVVEEEAKSDVGVTIHSASEQKERC